MRQAGFGYDARVSTSAAMLSGALVAAAFGALALLRADDLVTGWRNAANVTARSAVPVFLAAYCASSLVRLFGGPLPRVLLVNRRALGLAVAAMMTVHVGAILAHGSVSKDPHAVHVVDSGGLTYVFIYLMALTSNQASRSVLGRWWAVLHGVGMQVILIKFFSLVVLRNWPHLGLFSTIMGAAMVAAAGIRIVAFFTGRKTRQSHPQ